MNRHIFALWATGQIFIGQLVGNSDYKRTFWRFIPEGKKSFLC